MTATETASRLAPYIEQLLEDDTEAPAEQSAEGGRA
jgi:hypothetical protein